MAGYTRTDLTDQIANGNTINAIPLDSEYDAIQTAFAAVGGHKHDGTTGEGAPITVVGPVRDLVISANSVTPKTDNTLNLGSTTLEFKDLWIDGVANIDSLVADTADINAGTVDATVIGATTPAAITGTTITGTSLVGPLTGNVTGNAATVTTNANLTGHVTSVGNAAVLGSFTSLQLLTALTDETGTGANVFATSPTLVTPLLGTPTSGVMTNVTGTASGLTAGNVTTNANLTGHVTSTGNAAILGSFTKAQLDTAISDGNVLYVGDAPTSHTHLLAAGATDVTATAAQLNFVAGVTSAIQTQINTKAPLANPTFTGVPAAPTAAAATSTTQLATTAFVATSFAPLASPTFTGIPAAPTAAPGTNTTQLATTAFVTAAVAAGKFVNSALLATTSGTALDVTGFPAGVNRIEIYFDRVSSAGTGDLLVQLMVGGTAVTTGYLSYGGTSGAEASSTAGFMVYSELATRTIIGVMSLVKITADKWVEGHSCATTNAAANGGGVTTASFGTVTGVRITYAGGAAFDLGSIVVGYQL